MKSIPVSRFCAPVFYFCKSKLKQRPAIRRLANNPFLPFVFIQNVIMFKLPLTGLMVLFFSVQAVAQPSDSKSLKKQQQALQQEMKDLQRKLDATRKTKKASISQLELVKKKIRLREEAISNMNQQVAGLQQSVNSSRNEIENLKEELDTLRVQYTRSVVYAYQNRNNYDFLNFIFSATSFNDALKRVEYLRSYRKFRQQQADNIRQTQDQVRQKLVVVQQKLSEKDAMLADLKSQRSVLQEEREEKNQVLSKLKAKEKQLSAELAAKAKTDKKLKAGIAAAIRREEEKARLAREAERKAEAASSTPAGKKETATKSVAVKKETPYALTPEGKIVSENFENNKGKLPWPVEKGRIKLPFGWYSVPDLKITHNNPGITLETENMASVKAVFSGEVSYVFDIDGNTAVIISHGQYYTSYSNLVSTTVYKGQKVKTGDVLGKAAANSDGQGEIEFVINKGNMNLDPQAWIRKQ